MKKNRIKENIIIKKQFIKLVIANMFAFVIVYAILGVAISIIISGNFYSDLKKELKLCREENEYSIAMMQGDYHVKVNNARIKMVLFDENNQRMAYSKDLLNYIIPNYEYDKTITQNIINNYLDNTSICMIDLTQIDGINFEKVSLNSVDYNFITYSFEVNSELAKEVKYCKLLIMNNGEINIRNNVLKVYSFVASGLIVLGMLASVILSKNTIKPISDNMDKQVQFVSDASHELRTPLSVVQSKLENILTKTDQTVYDVSEDIAISLRELARLKRLTNDLLTLTRSDNNNAEINFESQDIADVIKDSIQIFNEMAVIEGREFIANIDSVVFNFDSQKIIQLITILLDNALKYTSGNETIEVNVYRDAFDCCIVVKDTGIGISDESKKKVFDRFYREDKARSRKSGGNGLGLAIGKSIVLSHSGKISVYDNKPKGTVFEVRLPIRKFNKLF